MAGSVLFININIIIIIIIIIIKSYTKYRI